MKLIILLVTMCILLPVVSSYYAGETIAVENPLGNESLIWTIIDNSTTLTILPEITYNESNIIIFFPSDMPPISFTIVFLEEQTREVIKEVQVSSGGGGGHSHTQNTTQVINNTIIKEVPTYLDREVLVYVNQTLDVPIDNETQSLVEEEVQLSYWWFVIIAIVIGGIVFFIARKILKRNDYTSERRYQNNEQNFND